jgi:hypothetical protein
LTRDKARWLDQIMSEMGQNPQQIAALAEDYKFKRQVLDLTPFKALRTYPIDVRLDELVNRLVADNGFLVGVESRLQWLIGEIVAAHDPSYVNDAGPDLELARRSRFGRPVDRRLEAIRDQLVGLGFVGRVVGQLRPRIESHWTGDWPDPAPVSFERLSDTDHQRYVEIRDHLVADDGFRDLVGEQLERDYVEVLQARPDWRDPAPVEEPEPVPVQAIEPAPAPAVEPVPVIAEELPPVPSPEPAPQPVEEPALELVEEPRVTSIEDLRGSIVLVPEYASRSMWA